MFRRQLNSVPVRNSMKQGLILLFAVFFPLSVAASAWAACFVETHAHLEQKHLVEAATSELTDRDHSETNHSAPRFHCSQPQVDFAPLATDHEHQSRKRRMKA
jgi:hypothetical protein